MEGEGVGIKSSEIRLIECANLTSVAFNHNETSNHLKWSFQTQEFVSPCRRPKAFMKLKVFLEVH